MAASGSLRRLLAGVALGVALALLLWPPPVTAQAGPFSAQIQRALAANAVVGGVAQGYRIARGSTAFDGSNPTTVATGLTTVVSCTATVIRNSAVSSGTAFVTHAAPSGANVDFYAWLQTGAASTNTENFDWICVGT